MKITKAHVEAFLIIGKKYLCPRDLIALKFTCKSFYNYIRLNCPDFDLIARVDKLSHNVKNAIDNEFCLFGSTLLKLLLTDFSSEIVIGNSDIDLFLATDFIVSRGHRPCDAVPKKSHIFKSLGKKGYWEKVDDYGTMKPFVLYSIKQFIDVAIGIKGKMTDEQCTAFHMDQSHIPVQRMFLSKNGFKCQKIENLFGKQVVKCPVGLSVLFEYTYFAQKLGKFVDKNLFETVLVINKDILDRPEIYTNIISIVKSRIERIEAKKDMNIICFSSFQQKLCGKTD